MTRENFTEVVAVDRQRDRVGDELWPSKKRPDKELPVLKALFPDDAQAKDRPDCRLVMAQAMARAPHFNGAVLF